jgi:NAD-dependent deacetylase
MHAEADIEQAQELLRASAQAVALTGAGVSTASGIPDFRSPGSGIWERVDPMEVASIYAFRRHPEAFYEWIRPVAELIRSAVPNAAHLALARLEAHGPLAGIITQNIDMLHSKAGTRTVYEVHGHLRQVTCLRCYSSFDAQSYFDCFVENGQTPRCELCGGVVKPDVILFGEQLPVRVVNAARKQVRLADLMLVAGTSLEVVPAAELPLLALEAGARLIIVNREPTNLDSLADVVIHGDVVDVLPRLAEPF